MLFDKLFEMPAGRYLYRLLREDEDPKKGLSARNPEVTNAKVSSHINGLKKSPYISTTASKNAVEAFYWLALKKNEKKKIKQTRFTIVRIDKDKLLKDCKSVEIIDLSDKSVRDEYLAGNKKLQNYAAKYEEVLIKGFVPAEYVTTIDINALSDSESSSGGYEESDYTPDEVEELVAGAGQLQLK